MRRILNTSTAIVASLSLIAPQVAPAFAQGAPSQEQIILQQKQQQKQKQQQQKQREQKQKAARQEQQKKQQPKPQQQRAQAEQPKPRQQPQQERRQQPQREAQPQREQKPQRQAQPQREQKSQAQPQRDQQQPRHARPQGEQPPSRQAQPQREQKPQRQARPQREEKPQAQPQRDQQPPRHARPQGEQPPPRADRREERQAEKPAQRREADNPTRRPANPQDDARGQQSRPAAQGNAQPKRTSPSERMTPPPNAQELRRAMDEKQRPRPQQRAGEQRQTPPARTEEQRRDAQRQAEQRRQQNAKARPQPQQLSPEEMRRRIDSRQGKTDLPAPEARSRPNEVMRLAASRDQAPKAAALTAGAAGNDRRDNVRERRITQENARRSDQDFRNRIEDGMRPRGGLTNEEMRRQLDRRERELRQDERRVDRRERALDRRNDYWDDYYDRDNDDDDDKGSDIAKLLLAGVAGFAVGRMLSGNRQVALNTGDRAVLTLPDGSQQIVRDDNALLYRPGSDVQTETFADGSTRTTVLRADGSRVVTIRDADTNILQRTLVHPNGTETRLMDNTYVRPVQVSTLPPPQPVEYSNQPWGEDDLRTALLRESATDRRFTLGQVRDIPEVRSLVAPVNVPDVTFDSGSAALTSDQAEQLATFGKVIRDSIDQNPNEVYMIEGYTDAVGSDAANLALSDRRAESVALALTEYYQVPPENMVVQGYGEQYMLIPSDGDERDNRRVAIRRITDLLEQSGS